MNVDECSKCEGLDAQLVELMAAWKEIKRLDTLLQERPVLEDPVWEKRYHAIKEAYIKTRLEVSGSFGNWSGDTRRRVLEHEISAELGFDI